MRLPRGVALVCAIAGAAPAPAGSAPVGTPGPAAEGYVTVVREGNTWWLRDGKGKLFFSLGVNCVAGCFGHAEDRPVEPARRDRIIGQLRAWGFNTAACWSSPSVWPELYVADELYGHADPKDEDIWDERFWTAGWFPELVRSEVEPFRGNRGVIGLFVDNEPHWESARILRGSLSRSSGSPGSRALLDFARRRYPGGIGDLNREWGTRLSSFDAIPGWRMPKKPPDSMGAFMDAWRIEVVGRFYSRYVALVRSADPGHLILGVRWAGLPNLDLYKALSPLFDVNSVNDYTRYGTLRPEYGEYYEATGKPIMITEYSFSGYPEPGHRSLQFCDVGSQEHRAIGYAKYVTQAAKAPFMVGMHWFLWNDYDKQDEEDGYPPDENMGLVSADESVVYDDLAKACARTNASVDSLHRAAAWTAPAARPPVRYGLAGVHPKVDGDISEWPVASSVTPWTSESLLDGVESGHRYWLAADGRYLYVAADIKDTRIDDPGEEWCWEGDYLVLYAEPGDSGSGKGSAIYVFPTRGGRDHRQPYAGFWGDRPVGDGALSAKRATPGGYTLEARLPLSAVTGKGSRGGSWKLGLSYRNVSDLYETSWEGLVDLPKGEDK